MKQLKPNMEIRFWRTKQGDEVDFIILKNRIPFAIEVKSNLVVPDIPNGIKKFLSSYKEAQGAIVFNDGLNTKIKYGEKYVHFLNWQEAENIEFMKHLL